MDEQEIDEKFGAIVIAIESERIDVARQVFDILLEEVIKDEINREIESIKRNIEVLLFKR